MVLGIILSRDKYSRLRSMIGRATPRRVTGIFRDFLFNGEEEKERRGERRGREGTERKRRRRGVTNAHRFVTNRFAMNRDFIGFN